MWKTGLVMAGICILLLGACGAEESEDRAMEYALEKSGGTTTGCSSAEPGEESENDPGCIFGVAFIGCQDGLEGSEDAIAKAAAIRDEFPEEPKLWEIYDQAATDCRN
jgi:hypothetical protein